MLLTISTSQPPATQLARLLGQHPDAVRAATYPFGHAMVCFPQADDARCSAAVMLQHPGQPPRGSLMADALGDLFAPVQLVGGPTLPLDVDIPVVACPGGPERIGKLFGARGYHVTTTGVTVDEWAVRLTGVAALGDLLGDLCAVLPAIDEVGQSHVRRARYAACAHQ